MFRPRVIPVLLLKDQALVKSVRFKNCKYIGDPINAVRIFNELKADELVFLDIDASRKDRAISLDFVREVGEEAFMPFSVGGGVRTIEDIKAILAAGAEKVIVGTRAGLEPAFIREASERFGSSTIVVCMDVKKKLFYGDRTWVINGSRSTPYTPLEFARLMEENGAGELIVQSIDRDGTMNGYDVDLIKTVSTAVGIPVIALGGAGRKEHLTDAFRDGRANALAAGSMFVFQDKRRGVLINYPEKGELVF
ncbi:MAG: imidazole glycerol phosphate synthase subunit HisF [Acidobacteria bacterium]|nr:MAG: imidazole glycerol phosphate synthase subunit HisF [Acidobacteriota bacterium]